MGTVRTGLAGRRDFLSQVGIAGAAWATAAATFPRPPVQAAETAAEPPAAKPVWPVAIFSKVFQKCSFDELAGLVVEIGADGVELPLRRGGHIEPANAASEVPKLVKAFQQRDKQLLLAATDITTADDSTAAVLQTLRDHGVTHYRTGYYLYSSDESRWDQLKRFTDQAQALAELNQRIGIVGVYQNHAGPRYVGSVLWDLAQMMHQLQSPWLGVALDLRHTRAEIGVSWPAIVELIQPSVYTVFAKNTTWRPAASGSGQPRLVEVPLAEGMADHAMFSKIWKAIAQPAPLSVHVEYLGQQPRALAESAELVAAYQTDVATLRAWMG